MTVAALGLPGGAATGAPASRAAAQLGTRAGGGAVQVAPGLHRAPSGAPLPTGATGLGGVVGAEEAAGNAPPAEADPLVSNGLGSPTCRGPLAGELSASGRRNCETSGFVAAPAPTGDYGLDVHIDTGVLGISSGGLLSTVQDLLVTPLWMALVWAVHALVVMLEWCFTIDLLDSAAAAGVSGGLLRMQTSFTEPWLPLALAVASVLVLYHGLIRRRVAETLGEALVMLAMMAGGIWIIADPTATVGALGAWSNQASLGTLAIAATGAPSGPGQALAGGLDTVFTVAIEVPWCYLEFGDVAWCTEPSRLDPRLRAAALTIATHEAADLACQPSSATLAACVRVQGADARALEHSARLLRDAQSNGAMFLALPANGVARNSINEQGSLLRTLCQSSEATNCRGATAAQAEFRTNRGTWPRVGGLLLIAGGLLGMLLLFGFLALRLLAAAIFSLLYLLLAPVMVLAPAFGQAGRALFRRWAVQLLGAVVSKLVFSFLLGVILAVLTVLSHLDALGWWTQWLLMSAFWWAAYLRRHQVFGVASAAMADAGSATEHARRRSVARTVAGVLEGPRTGIVMARWSKHRLAKQAPEMPDRTLARVGHQRARAGADEQVVRTLEAAHRDATARATTAPETQQRLTAERGRQRRLERERDNALSAGDSRRAAELGLRARRVQSEIEHEQDALSAAQRLAREGQQAHRRTGAVYSRERRGQQDRLLDVQAALPPRGRAAEAGARRDYAALAGLAGYTREEYGRLGHRPQRAARLEIDRELALRKELRETARTLAADDAGGRPPGRGLRKAARRFDGAVQRGLQDAGHSLPASRRARSRLNAGEQAGYRRTSGESEAAASASSVMRDAREVAARRKRQLGGHRP
jgi:TrbL/VirB6 plasmid conjugal transfer protein